MARSPLQVDKKQLQDVINQVESEIPLLSQGELYQAISQTEWAKGIKNANNQVKGISPEMIGVKIREYKLTFKTPKGKRNNKGGVRTKRADKLKDGVIKDVVAHIKKYEPEISENLLEKYSEGSMSATLKLRCIRCNPEGYKTCNDNKCESLPFNKLFWKRKVSKKEVVQLDLSFITQD